ncbi:hypothetical protein A6V36_35710 [Paraburkholderia ginsengiterrae]|uniref:Uncharacterized protein n=1 Tax=Paraburkholderia ginsengiterrae TaxID=1462993 RepID=A0A1A9N091_9BURK|nr:hypothetical protein [Paraburkholderia ginsengiterrae]OAJ53703.1 hypothetical protein A6V37_35335 [Paraburkholderia ginsengiterrae]OAJ54715.1 hypothetical protein A6V36_35710 [Paraburkholderia ginsengiterrae]
MTMDEDIAHVARVMVPSLSAFRGEPVLQPQYWRMRLERILDACHLTESQRATIQQLLRELDRFEAKSLAKKEKAGLRIPAP